MDPKSLTSVSLLFLGLVFRGLVMSLREVAVALTKGLLPAALGFQKVGNRKFQSHAHQMGRFRDKSVSRQETHAIDRASDAEDSPAMLPDP